MAWSKVKQSRYIMHASYENSNKVVNNTYPYFPTLLTN